jgi:hypothetical protein
MTSSHLSPHSTQLSISSSMLSPAASPGSWLSSYKLDVSDDKGDDLTPADSAKDAVGDVLFAHCTLTTLT